MNKKDFITSLNKLKIIKILLPFFLFAFLYKYSYISFDPIKTIFYYGKIKLIILIFFLSLACSFSLYFRFSYCLYIYKIRLNKLKSFEISSQAYSFASFIPGQLGIDALRIGKLRKLDLTKFKTNLIKSTILEKIFALLSQIFIVIIFILNDNLVKFLFFVAVFILFYLISFLIKKGENKFSLIKKFTEEITFYNISRLFLICILANIISCYLIKSIAVTLDMNYSLKVMSISSILSNIAGIIPISPNGLGISEFVFSEVTQNFENLNTNNSIATIYFAYRILNLFSHFAIYYFIKLINSFKQRLITN